MANTIIRASAGSGKTYQLSNRFLQQIFDAPSVEAVLDSILASTFTRKAAGEITDRIFTKFADATLHADAREKLRRDLRFPHSARKTPGSETKELERRLAVLARNMYRLRVGTLDSYFNRIASAFSLELGFPLDWSILNETDYEKLLAEAARQVFEESERNGAKTLMHLLQKGRSEALIISNLVELAKSMLALVRVADDEAWEHDLPGRLQELTGGLLDDERLRIAVDALGAVAPPPHKSFQKELTKLHALFFEAPVAEGGELKSVAAVDWKKVLNHGLVKNIITDVETYYKTRISKEIKNAVLPLMEHGKSIQVLYLIDQTRATRDLLKLVAAKLDELMIRERKFHYDDITRMIAEYRFDGERLKSLNHRLNGDTKHLLLDEFQDTSPPQWDILRPLAEKITQEEQGTFFCVGDVKQSIYSWRGGVAAIFDTMQAQLERAGAEVKQESMNTTRRNRPVIVETVNELFQDIRHNQAVLAAAPLAGKQWQQRFQQHQAHEKDAGYCTLEESPFEPDEETKEQGTVALYEAKGKAHLQYTVDRIVELAAILENRPALDKGIGVLVFTTAVGACIVSELKRRGIEVNGGGGSLADSAAVRYVLSAMILADHPGDTIARFHLATGELKDILGIKDNARLEKYGDIYSSQRIRHDLITKGYGETIRKYAEVLAPSCDPHEFLRLEKLLELAYRFDEEADGIRTHVFIERVENTLVAEPGAANITVSTIHGAKGLEYDIVVLPQLDWGIAGMPQKLKFVVGHTKPGDKTTPIHSVLRYADAALQSLLPVSYKKMFEQHTQNEVEESLSELYVAMTRAVYQLVMIVPPKTTDSVNKTFEGVLRSRLKGDAALPAGLLYKNGDEKWFEKIPVQPALTTVKEWQELTCTIPAKTVLHHVPRIAPSRLHKSVLPETAPENLPENLPESLPAAPIGGKGHDNPLAWGTAIHACFESGVVWLDETQEIGEDILQEAVAASIRGEAVSFTPKEVVAQFRQTCKRPEIIQVLSRSRYFAPNVTVERERRFAVWYKGEIMRGIIDRLVVCRDTAGDITEIEIIDYKSDSASDVNSLVAAYREQLEAYREGIAALFQVDTNIIKTTFVFTTLGRTASL